MLMDDEVRDMILRRAPTNEIREKAIKKGMRTLFDDGIVKVSKGITTIGEVLRVTEIELDAE
jgi:type II secretory ATPase GspE/PulE/Tfp pilus assembly ATPase PilB-like protein